MSLILRPPWTRQPQWATRPCAEYRGLIALWNAATNVNAVAQASATINGTDGISSTVGAAGRAYAFANGSGTLTTTLPRDPASCTYVFTVSNVGGDLGRPMSTYNGVGGHDLYVSAIFGISIVTFLTGGNQEHYFAVPSTTDRPATVAIAIPAVVGVAPTVYVDGRPVTVTLLATGSGSRVAGGTTLGIGCRPDSTARQLTGRLYMAAMFDRALTPGELAALSGNPWQLFEPRRIWVPVSAAGGGVDLVIADATHAHAADAPTLTTTWLLTVADATHSHAADAPTLSTEWLLAPADALHGHAADNLTLEPSGSANLAPADATHGHTADAITLTTASLLAVQDALHAHAAEAATLSTEWLLAPADATHAHAADNLTLSDAPALLIAEALHAHTADGVTMTVDAWLVLADATHGHLADNVVLFVPGGASIREVLRLSSALRQAVTGSSTLTRTVALASDIDAESTTP